MSYNFNKFIKSYNNLQKKYNYEESWIGLVGKNYYNGIVSSFKVYYQIYNKILQKEYPFEKNYELYNNFFNFIDHDRCANNGIALKYNIQSREYNGYFHIKFNKDFNFNEKDNFILLPLNKFKKAVSVEFNENTDIRRYYYIDNIKDMEYVLSFFKIKEDASKLKYIEYTHNPKKIILIFKNISDVQKSIDRNCCNNVREDVCNINKCHNTTPTLFGKYLNLNKFSIYWDINRDNNFINSFLKTIN
jgi:hypothetical protein